MGQSSLPVVFKSQGLARGQFLLHFDKSIAHLAEEIGTPIALLKFYWSRRLSLTLQRSVAQAIDIRMATLYNGPKGPSAVDESVWSGVVASQSQASAGSSRRELKISVTPSQDVILQACHFTTRLDQLTTIIIFVVGSSSRVVVVLIIVLKVLHLLKSFSLCIFFVVVV